MFTFSAKCLFFICVRVIVLEIVIYKFPQGQLARWLESLSQYDFDIQHRPGLKQRW